MAEKEKDSAASSKHSFSTNIEDYREGDVIGTGATSIVYRAEYIPTGEQVAIKKINLEKCSTSVEELLKEIQAMSQCQHENVVQYYTSFVDKEDLCVVMQLCQKGSLLDVLKYRMKHYKSSRSGVLDEGTIATVLKEVLKALEYFHSNGQIHRDIKAGNILLAQDGSIRIADFGVSAWLAVGKDHSREQVRHTFVGTPCWMAPEVMEQVTGYDYKADIWSFGITAIELATGAAPYHKFPPMKVLMLTLQNDPPTLDSADNDENQYKAYGKTFRKMIAQCLRKDPAERSTAKELLKHDFFTRKAKDKAHLLKALEQETYIMTKDTKRVAGSSGRFHKNEEGKWVWSSDEESDDEFDSTATPQANERGQLAAGIRNTLMANDPQATITSNEGDSTQPPAVDSVDGTASSKPVEQELHLVLRLRNEQRELHDIKFEFTIGRDTSQSVSHELVEACLVDGQDLVVMAANLDKIIERYTTGQREHSIVFRLNSGCRPNEGPCDKTLLGFAQISITQ